MMNARHPSRLPPHANRFRQRGVAAVEFALVASLLFTLLFGVMEMGRVLFYWNTATEATRLGARLAVVCGKDAAVIKSRMGAMLGILAIGYLGDTDRKGMLIIGGATAFGVFIILFAVSTYFPFSLVALFFMGAFGSIYMITLQTSLQMRVPDELRGRVMGIYGVTHNLGPLGAMQAGLLASAFSAPIALVIGGSAIILFALGVAYSRSEVRGLQGSPAAVAA